MADETPSPPRSKPRVGGQVRRLRRERELTLTQVAALSGLNVGYLSQIENDKASPSLESLAAIGAALDVPITWFLIDNARPPRVVRAVDRKTWAGPGGVLIEEIDGGIPRDVRLVMAHTRPGERTGLHAHPGDEHHLLMSGRVLLEQGDTQVELGPGDYLVWDATIPHDSVCLGDEPAVMLIVSHRAHGTESAPPAS